MSRELSGQSARDRRPPDIVAASDDRGRALLAFIGQELEHAGFHVRDLGDGPYGGLLAVNAAGSPTIYVSAGELDL